MGVQVTEGRGRKLRPSLLHLRVAWYDAAMARAKINSGWTAKQLKAWADRLELNRDDAAAVIGVNRATFFRYLNGEQPIPLTVELACRFVESQAKLK